MDLCGLAGTFIVQLICKSCLVFAFCWAFSFSLVHVCRFGQLWVCGWPVSTLHACKSRVFRSAYQTQMAVFFPPRTSSEISLSSVVFPTWDYNLSEPLFAYTILQCIKSGESLPAVAAGLVPRICHHFGWTAARECPGWGSTGSPQAHTFFPELGFRSKHFLVCCRYSVHFYSAEMAVLFNCLSRFIAAFLRWFISLFPSSCWTWIFQFILNHIPPKLAS